MTHLCMCCMGSLAGLTKDSSRLEVPWPPNQNPKGRSELKYREKKIKLISLNITFKLYGSSDQHLLELN